MSRVLFNVIVSCEYQQHGDGNDELYIAQAIAPNGEKLHYRAEAASLWAAFQDLAGQIRRQTSAAARAR